MNKKQGIIENKMSSKPSFKNLIDLDKAKVPNKSRSRNKSISQNKISTLPLQRTPHKSPSKTDQLRQESSLNISVNRSKSRKTQKHKQSHSPKSTKKSEKLKNEDQQNLKKIINLKNKTMQLEQVLSRQEKQCQQQYNKQKKNYTKNKNETLSVSESDEKLKKMKNLLDDYLNQLKRQTKEISLSYMKKLDELKQEKMMKQREIFEQKKIPMPKPGMPRLQQKLNHLSKIFNVPL